MNWFEKLIYALQGKMQTPTYYGWFHCLFIAIFVALCILCVMQAKKHRTEKSFKIIVWVCWSIMFVLELYKQLIYSFRLVDGVPTWHYQWYAFPYQLCSTPLYVLPIIGCLKPGKVRDALMSYISTFAFFGGFVVFAYPGDVFVRTIGINIQTMVHHGLQLVTGIYFVAYNREKINFKYFLKAIYVFVVAIAVAMILNAIVPNFTPETFNMFYISPKFPCTLPLLSLIYPKVPYLVFLLIYILGFCLAAFIIHLIYMLCTGKFCKKRKQSNENQELAN